MIAPFLTHSGGKTHYESNGQATHTRQSNLKLINVDSAPGEGTTFTVALQVA
jgi:hypothetical protein